ncbi:MAG TPA: FIST N-terminal domain-containing protein [Chitinophagaceae bacterium]
MKARSIKGNSPGEIQAALNNSMADGFKPTLAIVFISIRQDRNAVCKILSNEGLDVLGATSCGEFTNDYQEQGSAVILLLDLNREYYTILFEDIHDRNLGEAATHLANTALQKFNTPAFIVCSTGTSVKGEIFDGQGFVNSLEKVIGPHVKMYGGMAGDDYSFSGSFVFTNEKSTDEGIVALILDEDKVSVTGMAISGWQPVGTVKTVTRSEDGWLYTIDDKPALDMYLRYLGKQSTDTKFYEEVGLFYPFQVIDATDPVMRTPMSMNKDDNALKLDFPIPAGTKLQFSMPPDFDIVENVLEKATDLRNAQKSDAEALLIFSCAGRLNALGPMTKMENDGLSEIWKTPMVGFFTYGEYGTAHGKQEFHSTTISWAVLKEK